jgi:hypothetical protein
MSKNIIYVQKTESEVKSLVHVVLSLFIVMKCYKKGKAIPVQAMVALRFMRG